MIEVSKTQREVSIILDEASVTVEDGYFGDPEEAHFRGRIDEIEKRTIAVGENASKEQKRYQYNIVISYFLQYIL